MVKSKTLRMMAAALCCIVATASAQSSGDRKASAQRAAQEVVTQSEQRADSVKSAAEKAADEAGTRRTLAGDRQAEFVDSATRGAAEAMKRGLNMSAEERAVYEQKDRVDRELQQRRTWFEEQQRKAATVSNSAIEDLARQHGVQPEKQRPTFVVLISQSMGADGIKAALEYGRGRSDVGYAFRGFKPGQEPKDMYMLLANLMGRDEDRIANVTLDPPSFRDNKVTTAPTMLYLDESGRAVAQVRGVVNPDWLKRRIDAGEKGDLGKFGETYAVVEEDLIEVMKKRVASLDLEKEKREAAQRYFSTMPVIELPYATEKRRREILAQMVVKEDVVDRDGVVRYRKGEVVSMRDEMPHAPVLVAFNSQDPYHVAFAKSIMQRFPNRNVILMTTQVDRDGGFAKYISQEQAIGRAVFLLTPEVQSTFRIEKIPTLVAPLEDRFAVVEVPLTQGVRGNADSH